VLASLAPFPPRMVAIEGWERNAPVAHRRLAPLGVPLVRVESERPLPFPDETFDLCLNRHDGYEPQGLYRVLARGGRFLTQQVGGRNCAELNDLLACLIPFEFGYWTPDFAVAALERAGLRIVRVAEAFPPVDITDIGAVHYYLRIVSWQMKDYDTVTYHDRLLALHRRIERAGPLRIHEHRFLIEARRR
jgi:SAM-dependent methyltransferase